VKGARGKEDYSGWPLQDRLELLVFEVRLAGVTVVLLAGVWEALDLLKLSAAAGFPASKNSDEAARGGEAPARSPCSTT
jgi:hypothetical protein